MILLNKKIGERWTQIIGGILTTGGMAGTAFTTEAWQGFLSNSIATGKFIWQQSIRPITARIDCADI